MCVDMVKHVGVHSTKLQPIAFWTNACGDRALECNVWDTHEATSTRRDFGKRFVYASQVTWSTAVSNAAGANFGGKELTVYLEPRIILGTNGVEMAADHFVLIPGDVRRRVIAVPPETCGSWMLDAEKSRSYSCPHYSTVTGAHTIEVIICSATIAASEARHKIGCWKPAQLLLLPAYVVDVVTSPIQFVIIMHRLSKIDG